MMKDMEAGNVDCFDSLTADDNETSFVVPVKNFMNDAYAGDISRKVKSHQKIKMDGYSNLAIA